MLSVGCCAVDAAGTAEARPGTASTAARFPRPDFESGYELPTTTTPPARADVLEYLDVAVLAAALALASYLAIRRRSRRSLVLLSLFSLLYFGFWRKGCVCPVGAIQNVTAALVKPGTVLPLTVLAFFLLPLFTALLFGRTFCAAVCPLGAVQDLVVLKPMRVPGWLARALGLGPYLHLTLAVLFAATGTSLLICRFDPFIPLFRLHGPFYMFVAGAAMLGLGIFVARPYCRFLCPYSVLLHAMSRLSKWHVTITPDDCIHCRLCEQACPFEAIRPANVGQTREDRAQGVRRLTRLLILLPLMMVAGAWAGSQLTRAMLPMNSTARLAEQIWREDAGQTETNTLESITFRTTGIPTAQLFKEAAVVRSRLRFGGWLAGAFLGLVVSGRLIGLSVWRTKRNHEPDRGDCLSCGRCFLSCPRERLRLKTDQVMGGTS